MRTLLLSSLLLLASLAPAAAQSPFATEIPVRPPAYESSTSYIFLTASTVGEQTLVLWSGGESTVHAVRLDAHANPVEAEHVVAAGLSDPRLVTVGDHWLLLSHTGGDIRATVIGADGKAGQTTTVRAAVAAGGTWAASSGGDRILIVVSEFLGVTGYVVDADGRLAATTPRLLQASNALVSAAGSGSDFLVRMELASAPATAYARVGRDGAVLASRDLSTLRGFGGMTWDGRQYIAWAQSAVGATAMVLSRDLAVGPMFRLTAAPDLQVDWIAPAASGLIVGSHRERGFSNRWQLMLTRVTPPLNPAADVAVDEAFFARVSGQGDELVMIWALYGFGAMLAAPVDATTLAAGAPHVLLGQPRLPKGWAVAGENGRLFALWEERAPNHDGHLLCRLFTREGPVGEPREIAFVSGPLPAVAFDGERYWGAWRYDHRVVVQYFDREGTPNVSHSDYPVSAAGVAPDVTSISIGTAAGKVIAIWTLINGVTQGATFDADPRFFRPVQYSISPPAAGNLGAALAVNADRALVAWLQPESPQGEPAEAVRRDVLVTAMTLSGVPVSPVPLPVAPAVAGRGRPTAATDGQSFLIAWWEPDTFGGVVRAAEVSADGVPGQPRTIVRTGAMDAEPALIRSGNAYRLAWSDGGRALTQRLTNDGAPIGGPALIWEGGAAGVQLADVGDGFAAIGRHPAPDPVLPPFDRLFVRFSLPQAPRVRAIR